ncbi:MAG: hypothetical protein V5A72_02715 [Candidatus Nanohaloarchaea archaeon]
MNLKYFFVNKFENEDLRIEAFERPGNTSTEEDNEDKTDFLLEDSIGYVWVMDGASPLSDSILKNEVSDGRWYVETLNKSLRDEIKASNFDRDIENIIKTALESVKKAYKAEIDHGLEDISAFSTPSSKISLARWDLEEGILETYDLGDSAHIVWLKGSKDYVKHGGPENMDEKVFDAMKLIQSHEQDMEALNSF